jgi:hypothetical protein
MDSTVDKARGELAEERTGDGGGRSETRGTLYGQGVPTAEPYVDDMPLEWSRDETGAGPEMPGEAANPPGLPDDPPRTFLTIRRRFRRSAAPGPGTAVATRPSARTRRHPYPVAD